jgi:hypothetical protein
MKLERPGSNSRTTAATAAEHLLVQREIERRAHELWRAGGCRHNTTLHDWLLAEREILEQFHQTRLASGRHHRRLAGLRARQTRSMTRRASLRTQINRKGSAHESHL